MAAIPTYEPVRIIAGDTLTWRRDDLSADYPPGSGWTLSYRLVNAAGKIDIAAAASDGGYLVDVAASATASYAPGEYRWVATMTLGGRRATIGAGDVAVAPDLAAATAADTRSAARKALDAADTALATYGSKAYLQEIDIGGRRQRFASASDFLAYRSRLQAEVAREVNLERLRQGLAPRNKLLVRFTR